MQSADLVSALRASPAPVPAGQLAAALGISQPTLSRRIALAGPAVVRIGRARATRYALAREIARAGSRWPLYRIDRDGRPERLGELRALRGEGFHFEAGRAMPAILRGEFAAGVFPGLPWFLDDQRPQGFLGRAFARRHGPDLGAPTDVLRWNQDDVVLALLRHGENLAGDLVLGEATLERALQFVARPTDLVHAGERATAFAALAESAMRGELPGSSAAGERPKFAVTLRDADGDRGVIVKFSERAGSPAAQRWADLLACEALAGETLRDHGIAAARARIVRSEGRTFLQSARFDRTPRLGRHGFVSLASLDAAFHGHGAIAWWRYAPQLQREGWLDADDARRLAVVSLFGALIGNTDMHLGNVGLGLRDTAPFALCPVYDMLPMLFAPAGSGEVVQREFVPASPTPENLDAWRAAAPIAADFWRRAAGEAALSLDFRRIASLSGDALAALRDRVG